MGGCGVVSRVASRMADQLTEEQRQQFKEAFQLFDADGTGSIDNKELGACLRALGQSPSDKELSTMIDEVDLDKSGTIDFGEFLLLLTRNMRSIDYANEMRNAFRCFDTTDTQRIPFDELCEYLTTLGEPLTPDEVRKICVDAEALNSTNEDNLVEMVEYMKIIIHLFPQPPASD